MCGIIGYVGHQDAAPILLAGLRRLEYRGYDSAGVALQTRAALRVHKAAGKLAQLEARLPRRLPGHCGIGHTRWATHGAPNDVNAHPHVAKAGRLALVHNGIVENAASLRARLADGGEGLVSDTDSEVLAHLIAQGDGPLEERVREVLRAVHGTYGIAVVDLDEPDTIVAARNGSPVIIGIGEREMFIASDVSALVRYTRQVVHLDDGEVVVLRPKGFTTSTLDDTPPATKAAQTVTWSSEDYDRGGHAHYMLKEIEDQPAAVAQTLRGRLDHRFATAHLGGLNVDARELLQVRRVKLLGCGSAYYAGQAGAHLIETLARIPADAEAAAEFRYRNPVIERDTLYVAISQSGETLDTLMAVQEVRRRGGRVLGIVNVVGSSVAREVDGGVYIHAGPEVSVASTKAYTCTVTALALLALHLGRIRDLSPERGRALVEALEALPAALQTVLDDAPHIKATAARFQDVQSAFFIGRGLGFPIALEGAQKLKEIAYIHAEAYPASELKHGPLALVTPDIPTVVVVPDDALADKTIASMAEIRTRGGPLIAVTASPDERIRELADAIIEVPSTEPTLAPIVMAAALQLFAYHSALALGRDIDQPRNLAKSVTVE